MLSLDPDPPIVRFYLGLSLTHTLLTLQAEP